MSEPARKPSWTDIGARGWSVALAIGLVWVGVFDNELVNWDDGNYITENPLVTAPESQSFREHLLTPGLGYPMPLPVLLHRACWSVAHAAWPFHALSWVLHVCAAVLLFRLLVLELSRPKVAWLAAVIFAVHPIVVEPVAWATGLEDLLVLVVMLGSLHLVRRSAVLASALGFLALASKPVAALFGPVLMVARSFREGAPKQRAIHELVPPIILTIAGFMLVLWTIVQESPELRTTALEPTSAHRIFGALGLQVHHLLVPASLAPRYPVEAATLLHDFLGALAFLGVLALGVIWVRSRDFRLAWLALGAAAYIPVSNLRPLQRFTADSYVLVPWLVVVALCAHGFVRNEAAIREVAGRTWGVLRASFLLLPVALVPLTVLQIETWANTRSLWGSAAAAYPDDGESIFRYGDALGRAGEPRAEIELYLEHESAIERSPKIPPALVVWYEHEGNFDRVDELYALGFESDVEQEHGFYWHYVEHVARRPERHPAKHDVGLAHALGVYAETIERSTLSDEELRRLSVAARALGRTDVAEVTMHAVRGDQNRAANDSP